MAFPFRFKRGDVDDNAATGIGALAQADCEYVTRDTEVLDSACQCERIWWNDAHITLNIDEAIFIEVLWINDCRVDVGKHLELIGASHIVAVAAGAVTDDLFGYVKITLRLVANLSGVKSFEHRHPMRPEVFNTRQRRAKKMFSLANLVRLQAVTRHIETGRVDALLFDPAIRFDGHEVLQKGDHYNCDRLY